MSEFLQYLVFIGLMVLMLGLAFFFALRLSKKNAFSGEIKWLKSTSFWKILDGNKEALRLFFRLAGIAFLTLVVAATAINLWEDHSNTIIGIGFLGLYGIWKIGKWVLIFGFAYFVIKTVVNGIIEAVSDRVVEKMRDRN